MELTAEVFCDSLSIVGESPIWDSARNCLVYVDIRGKRIQFAGENKLFSIDIPQQIGSVILGGNGELAACVEDGIYEVKEHGILEPIFADMPLKGTRFNDVKVGPDGCLYGGTSAAIPWGAAFYRIDSRGNMKTLIDHVGNSNGMEWSADNKTLYFNDTHTNKTFVYTFDMKTGDIGEKRVLIDYSEFGGMPDGMTIDNNGNLWVALWGGAKVVCVDTKSSKVIEEIAVPAKYTSSCIFGGDDYTDLYITSAAYHTDLKEQPYAGGVFRVKAGAAGKMANRWVLPKK